jgi:hypothetical protein
VSNQLELVLAPSEIASKTDCESYLALLFVNEEKRNTLMLELVPTLKNWSRQCFKMFTLPGVDALAQEAKNASWWRTGLLLMLLLLIDLLSTLLTNQLPASPLYGQSFPRSSLSYLVIVFCNFFFGMGFIYLFARLLRGRGAFLAQCYLLLFPLILTSLAFCLRNYIHAFLTSPSLLLVVLQYVVLFVLLCYPGILYGRAIMAVHRLSEDKAWIAFLLGGLTFLLLSFVPGNPFQL